jgi:hypothetical protein
MLLVFMVFVTIDFGCTLTEEVLMVTGLVEAIETPSQHFLILSLILLLSSGEIRQGTGAKFTSMIMRFH